MSRSCTDDEGWHADGRKQSPYSPIDTTAS